MARHSLPLPQGFVQRGLLLVLTLSLLLACMGWVVKDNWSVQPYANSPVAQGTSTGFLSDGSVIEQTFPQGCQVPQSLEMPVIPVAGHGEGTLRLRLSQDGKTCCQSTYALQEVLEGNTLRLPLPEMATPMTGGAFTLTLSFDADAEEELPSLWLGTDIDTGRFSLTASHLDGLTLNGEAVHGQLVCTLSGYNRSSIMTWYWPVWALLTLLGVGLVFRCDRTRKAGGTNLILTLLAVLKRYSFLIKQLVSRDFNTKYRQSVLGILWSFLNPLMTMAVQYVVFSTIFRNSIPNFPVYLTTGIILFNFFSEATSLGMASIVANGPLITKVYMPKYIYPLSRTLSSLINLVISFVPLLLMMLITGLMPSRAFLLLPLVVLFLFLFTLGMSMILATLNVFFRDTSFLWSVLVLLWTYATPIFYPESIIPASLITIYHMNPMYQFIYFLRCITIGGVAPAPVTFLYCTLCSVLPLLVGIWVFRKNQDKFVFHL